jgi:phage terminase large subunit-like protein
MSLSETPIDSAQSAEAIKRFAELATRFTRENRLKVYKPYPWQQEFHDAGQKNQERMLMAANRVGKTECAAAETAMHLTGQYPDDWTGKRFETPILVWTGSPTNESSRDIVQKALLGGTGEELGTGWVPRKCIIGRPAMRQAGVADVVDKVKIRHATGGVSHVVMKTYEQGWRKWQGTAPHVVWLDEEPEDYRIYTESMTRVLTTKGALLVTFTPLLGETTLVMHFTDPKAHGTYLKTATWDDAPHLNKDETARLKASYPDHEVQARTSGIPMMGEGRVFTVSEEDIKCEPFEIPAHYARICGIDFGIDHPAAAAWLAWDRDADVFYVHDCYRKAEETAVYHAEAINRRGRMIPVAWPHDGLNREKGGGVQLHEAYREHGVNMLGSSARYDAKKGGGQPQEPIIAEILEYMKTGRWRVFANLSPWFEEFRSYHRKDGRLVKVRDDIMKATFYGVMMKRYAVPMSIPRERRLNVRPVISARI